MLCVWVYFCMFVCVCVPVCVSIHIYLALALKTRFKWYVKILRKFDKKLIYDEKVTVLTSTFVCERVHNLRNCAFSFCWSAESVKSHKQQHVCIFVVVLWLVVEFAARWRHSCNGCANFRPSCSDCRHVRNNNITIIAILVSENHAITVNTCFFLFETK